MEYKKLHESHNDNCQKTQDYKEIINEIFSKEQDNHSDITDDTNFSHKNLYKNKRLAPFMKYLFNKKVDCDMIDRLKIEF